MSSEPEIERLVVVVNPRAGAGRAARVLPELEAALRVRGFAPEFRLSERPRHATALVRAALAEGVAGVAIVGGDGTLSEALAGYLDEAGRPTHPEAWLAPFPVGTGGDFRKSLGIPEEMGAVVDRFRLATPRAVDVGWLEYRTHAGDAATMPFLNIASFGLGGRVDLLVNRAPKWLGGRLSFLLGTLLARASYRRQRVSLRIDGEDVGEHAVMNVAIANGRFFGGGMEVAAAAELDDGLFEVVAQFPRSFAEELRQGRAIYRGELATCADVTTWRGATIEAQSNSRRPVLLDVDGEAPGALPARFSVRKRALLLR